MANVLSRTEDVPTIASLEIQDGAYRIFWLMGIKDVNLKHHCKKGLKGYTFSQVKANTTKIENYVLDEAILHNAYYLCGVFKKRDWSKNFHLAFQYEKSSVIEVDTGEVKVKVLNGKQIPLTHKDMIPGYPTLDDTYYHTCRNYRFAFSFLKQFKNDEYKSLVDEYVTAENKNKYDDYDTELPPYRY
ncbi:MAG: hypothetical protein ACRCVG_06965 [Methanobacteriaceae archaeon]